LLDDAEFLRLFDGVTSSAFRLEVRDRYNEAGEAEPLRRFLAGEPADDAWFMDWYDTVREWTRQGKRVMRVRVVSEPLSDYARWELDLARLNTEAGEDIRYLPRTRAVELQLPDEDYWLFDSREAAVLGFGDDDVRLEIELVTEPAEVARRRKWQELAWRHAVPYQEYVSS
jgi:hypothetical protein